MYLILYPSNRMVSGPDKEVFDSIYTIDMHRVSKALSEKEVRVFKIDSLTEIKSIDITYQEVTKEMHNG